MRYWRGLNDFARLATITLPPEAVEPLVAWTPEVLVPAAEAPATGRLVLVDTPGQDEAAASPLLAKIVVRHLAEAHGCVFIVDYTQLGSSAGAKLADIVAPHLSGFDPRAFTVVVNRVDQRDRGSAVEPDATMVRNFVLDQLGLPTDADTTMVETSAALGLAAQFSGDPAAFLALAYPTGPPEEPLSSKELTRLTTGALRRSGIAAAREQVFGRAVTDLPDIALRDALARNRSCDATTPAELITDVAWAATPNH